MTIRAALLTTLAALLVAAPASAATHGAARKHRRPPPPELALGPGLTAGPGAPVTMAPVGLSLEYPVINADLGTGECPPPALVAELRRLGSPPLQIAGQSQDFTIPAQLAPASPQSWEELTAYVLPQQFWTRLHCLLEASPDALTVGLNTRIGQLSWAQEIVAGAESAATAGLAFSLGNEPDLYYLPDPYSLDKPQANEEALDVGTYLRAAAAIRPATGTLPLVGPELSTPAHWQASLPRVVSTLGLRTIGVHAYPLSVCRTPRAATIGGLLDESVGDAPSRLAWVVADARADGIPALITEANSVSCGGKTGVSDSPASAVWAVRFVISALETGFGEVRFHFSGDSYDPFYLRGDEVLRRPLEAAIAALNEWLPVGASLHRLAGLKGTRATAIAPPAAGGRTLLLLDSGGATRRLVLRGASALARLQDFSAFGAPASLAPMKGPGTRVLLTLPKDSLLALAY